MSLDFHEMVELFEIQENLLPESATVEDAVRVLEKVVGKIVMVIGASKSIVGTVTDGDVRRHLLRHRPLDAGITEVMNQTPLLIPPNYNSAEIWENYVATQRCLDFPVVNAEGRVLSLLSYQRIPNIKKDTVVVLMAGGRGTRLAPLTDNIPKPLLEVAGQPIIEGTIKRLRAQGFDKFLISVNYLASRIRDHLGDGSKFGVNIEYLEENEPLGTAGCLALARSHLNAPFILMNGDIITNINFDNMLRFHDNNHVDMTMAVRSYKIDVPYGVVDVAMGESGQCTIASISEKPQLKFLVNAGIYVLSPEILDRIEDDTHLDMTTFCDILREAGKETTTFPIREYWMDVGLPAEFEKANIEYPQVFGSGAGFGALRRVE